MWPKLPAMTVRSTKCVVSLFDQARRWGPIRDGAVGRSCAVHPGGLNSTAVRAVETPFGPVGNDSRRRPRGHRLTGLGSSE